MTLIEFLDDYVSSPKSVEEEYEAENTNDDCKTHLPELCYSVE